MLNSEEEIVNATVTCVNFYAKTKLGKNFLIMFNEPFLFKK